MFGLSGCAKKYQVDYCGQQGAYDNAKKSYRAGEQVELHYKYIATDTDYSFYLDGEHVDYSYDDKHGFVISFIMPEHDVKLECRTVNSMVWMDPEIPEAEEITEGDEPVMLVDYYTAVVATVGGDRSLERVLYAYSDEQVKLVVYTKEDGEDEVSESYLVPYEAVKRCYEIIRKNKLNKWNDKYDGPAPTGSVTVVKFREDDGSYIRVSTDAMPSDGESIMDSIGSAMAGYAVDAYRIEENPLE